MPSGLEFNINDLFQEAKKRWLKPIEVLYILQNHEQCEFTNVPPHQPPGESLFLFNRRVLRFFRKDGHNWRKKRDGKTLSEAHERLKVGNVEALNCYYAHGEENRSFQRRSYWMLDPQYEHIVLVHYRETNKVGNVEALNCYYAHGEENRSFQRRSYWMLNPQYEHIVLVHYRETNKLEMLKRDETLEQSEESSPSDSVIKKTESENGDGTGGEVDGGCRGSENDEIIKELKKVKRQNFVTHCLLSVMIVLTVAWQLSEVSLILRVKERINHPFRSFGNMLKGIVKDKVPEINGNGNGQVPADHNKQKNGNGSSSLHSFKISEMPLMDVPNLGNE